MTSKDIEHIKALMERMQIEDPNYRVFGSAMHRYQLGTPLTESELAAFEQEHRITLPSDYRLFLKEAGNGGTQKHPDLFFGNTGAGPYYGLVTLHEAAQNSALDKPFLFHAETAGILTEEEVDVLRDPELFPAVNGALALCHRGSGLVYSLVITGAERGTIWQHREGFYPENVSFEEWYRQWINLLEDRAIPVLASERAIEGKIPLGMSKRAVIAICGGQGRQRNALDGGAHLFFDHLATSFDFDASETLTHVIEHDIS